VSPDPDLSLALALADAADAISTSRFGAHDLVVETKPDLTPVTEADRLIEETIRDRLSALRPDDSVLGEEFGSTGEGSRRWIVDPIDATRNYARGVPVWATLIAVEEEGELLAGVVSAPALGKRWWASKGSGSFANGARIHVSAVGRVEDAVLCFALENGLPELAGRCWHARGFGDFWAHMLVAEGAADGAIDATGVSVWDLAAVRIIVEEAGGRFSDAAGVGRIDGGSAISSNGLLHEALIEARA
jgi:histidinol-phosphatase